MCVRSRVCVCVCVCVCMSLTQGASGGPTLTRQHSGISRSSSFRAPSMSLTSMASMSNALQTSYTQSLDKYDLG